jgi:hypothetical protein
MAEILLGGECRSDVPLPRVVKSPPLLFGGLPGGGRGAQPDQQLRGGLHPALLYGSYFPSIGESGHGRPGLLLVLLYQAAVIFR